MIVICTGMPDPFGPDYTTDTRHVFVGDWVRVEGAQFIGVVRGLLASKPGFAEVAFGRLQEPYSVPLASILEVRHA